jgi:uncharacterized membrane protein (UPF0127 family)
MAEPELQGPTLAIDGRDTGWPVRRAESALARARGLLWGKDAASEAFLALRPCRGVHTFGMRRSIEVVFTDRHGRVRRICTSLRPWRMAWVPGAVTAWEAPAGVVARLGIREGVTLEACER